jgi:hypothetical protein
MDKTLVSTAQLKTILEWCGDAIDFNDDTDELAAKAWEALSDEIEN